MGGLIEIKEEQKMTKKENIKLAIVKIKLLEQKIKLKKGA
jgi:hypothetical protein